MQKRARVTGLYPILTKNFGIRGQIDLINYSTTPDRPYKYLLTYHAYSIKVVNAQSLTNKYLMAIVYALLSMFGVTGPLNILQSDNAGKFAI